MNVSKDLVAASAIPLILAILKENDSYGYAIIKKVKELSGNELFWTEGMLYPVLHRLEAQGLIESYWKGSQAGRPRKYYRVNEEGLKELDIQKKQWEMIHLTLLKSLGNNQ
jgi:DNA-binding PadR family transcriptional regulator